MFALPPAAQAAGPDETKKRCETDSTSAAEYTRVKVRCQRAARLPGKKCVSVGLHRDIRSGKRWEMRLLALEVALQPVAPNDHAEQRRQRRREEHAEQPAELLAYQQDQNDYHGV